ncbi:UNVERIFIED_CONTAM: hypothetical protein HDU68_011952 [Siphonaria sp. JEL0065]|nr:hypothetical protein HDU68_011952 [Siphonaria sp. JEL0065]
MTEPPKQTKSVNTKTTWDQKCFIFLSQTNTNRSQKEPPQATMRCIQRLLDGEGGRDKTILFKHSTDFVTVMNEAVTMLETPDLNTIHTMKSSPSSPTDRPVHSMATPAPMPPASSPSAQAPAPSSSSSSSPPSRPQPQNPILQSNNSSSHPSLIKDLPLSHSSPDTVAEYTAPKDSPALPQSFTDYVQTSVLAPSAQYMTRIYKPHINFATTYKDAVVSGKAFDILGRYYDAVVIEQRPLLIGWKMTEKFSGWVKAALADDK